MDVNQDFWKNIWASILAFINGIVERIDAYIKANPRQSVILAGSFLLIIIGFLIPVDPPHVALSGEPLFQEGAQWFTNSVLATIIIDIILIVLALMTTRNMTLVPSGLQNVMEALIEYLYNLAESVTGKAAKTYFPWVATVFLFILISNWSGLVPGVGSIGVYHEGGHGADTHSEESHDAATDEHGEDDHGTDEDAGDGHGEGDDDAAPHEEGEGDDSHGVVEFEKLAMADGNLILASAVEAPAAAGEGGKVLVPLWRAPSADLNMTFAFALVIMFLVQYYGVQALGGSYFKKFFTFSGEGFMKYINAFVGILELISEISRILTFAFRLFGNIFAGEIVLATMAFLVAFLIPLPFYLLEILVGAVQALVFMMLALAFFSMATVSHHDEEHH